MEKTKVMMGEICQHPTRENPGMRQMLRLDPDSKKVRLCEMFSERHIRFPVWRADVHYHNLPHLIRFHFIDTCLKFSHNKDIIQGKQIISKSPYNMIRIVLLSWFLFITILFNECFVQFFDSVN